MYYTRIASTLAIIASLFAFLIWKLLWIKALAKMNKQLLCIIDITKPYQKTGIMKQNSYAVFLLTTVVSLVTLQTALAPSAEPSGPTVQTLSLLPCQVLVWARV